MRLLATLVLLLAFPATAQQSQQAAPQGKATACSNNVNQAMGANNQGCSDTAANPNGRTTSKAAIPVSSVTPASTAEDRACSTGLAHPEQKHVCGRRRAVCNPRRLSI